MGVNSCMNRHLFKNVELIILKNVFAQKYLEFAKITNGHFSIIFLHDPIHLAIWINSWLVSHKCLLITFANSLDLDHI